MLKKQSFSLQGQAGRSRGEQGGEQGGGAGRRSRGSREEHGGAQGSTRQHEGAQRGLGDTRAAVMATGRLL